MLSATCTASCTAPSAGTAKFMEAMKEKKDANLIGQVGAGC